MSTSIREALLAAIATRLAGTGGATIERTRRTPVDTDNEAMPRLVLTGGGWDPDETAEPGRTHYILGFEVTGYVSPNPGADALDAEKALHALHAATVTQLVAWSPTGTYAGSVQEGPAGFRLYDASESSRPAGEFTAEFTLLAIATTGNPYV